MKYLLVLLLAGLGAMYLLAVMSHNPPARLGVSDNRLTDCPTSKNCVSSYASQASHHVEPLPMKGSVESVMSLLQEALEAMDGIVVERNGGYLRAEFPTSLWKFTDDLECLYDEAGGVVHIRSAARVGYYDFNVNRKRVEMLRSLLAQ